MKKKALIPKTQSQLPLKTINKLMGKDESSCCVENDIEVVNASTIDHRDHKIKTGSVVLSSDGLTHTEELSAVGVADLTDHNNKAEERQAEAHMGQPMHNEEDDYEDMVTPTDDEGITSLNHT